MTRREIARRFGLPAIAIATVSAVLGDALDDPQASEPLPWPLEIQVASGARGTSAGFREEVGAALTEALAARRCFVGVAEEATESGDPVVLRATLSDPVEETRHDGSLIQQVQPDEPSDALRYTSTFTVRVSLQILPRAGGVPLREDDFRASGARRPAMEGEDSRAWARDEAVSEIVRHAVAMTCKGSRERLRHAIEEAREGDRSR